MSEVFVISSEPKENNNTDAEKLYWNFVQGRAAGTCWVERLCEAQVFKTAEEVDKTFTFLQKALVDVDESQQKRIMIQNIKVESLPKKTVSMAKLKGI